MQGRLKIPLYMVYASQIRGCCRKIIIYIQHYRIIRRLFWIIRRLFQDTIICVYWNFFHKILEKDCNCIFKTVKPNKELLRQ